MGQESYLPAGTALVLKRYRVYSDSWEHDHCAFCTAKFMDANFSEAHRHFAEEHPEVLAEGYTTTDEHSQGAEYHWVCPRCFEDFAEEFHWRLIEN
jgi:hypothetical protein